MFTNIDRVRTAMPWAFIACFILSALIVQMNSDIPPWNDKSPIEYFTGGTLWMLSLLCLLNGLSEFRHEGHRIFWFIGSVVLAVLAIDEAAAGHEWVESNWMLNDDIPKIVLWIITLMVLRFVYSGASQKQIIKHILLVGYAIHSLYIIFEISDGEFFDASRVIAPTTAKWGEELCELFFLSAYWLGFFLFYQESKRELAMRYPLDSDPH